VLYEMLAGEMPYSGPNAQAVLARRLSEPAPSLRTTRDLPVAVERTVARALARTPADRYASAAEFARALQSVDTLARPILQRRWLAAAVVMLLLAGVAAVIRFRAGAKGPAVPVSAAVLPFADLSEGKDQEYFSDGLTDELIIALSRVEGINVAARTSSFQFKNRQVDVSEIGRQLHVGAILEGSVRRSGNRVRITAQLVSTRNGYQLWADAYDRELKDVFGVQEDIARSIIAALQVKLGARGNRALRARPTTDIEAYDLYLKGRFAWNQRTRSGMQLAVSYLEQAVARDSQFALAWAALADAYLLAIPYAGTSKDVDWPKAKAVATRALAIDSTLGEAYTALAYGTMIYDWDWPAAEEDFRRAIAVDPTYPTGHQWYGDFLWSQGRLREALDQMRDALRLDPLSLIIGAEVGQTFYLQRQYDSAEAQLRTTLQLDPNYPHSLYVLGMVYMQQHRYREARHALQRAEQLGGFEDDLAGALASAYAQAGDRTVAARYTAELERRLARGQVGPFALALAYTGQGDLTRGFVYLDRAITMHDAFLPEDFLDPQLDRLRADPRFAAIEAHMRGGGGPSH